ncbi:SLC13 family permease [Turneriella parva]|uniref:Anion transporter n=1 Tax=Turneriella parva (strain ATCC BAA-1111 / DSM 21527 / NCTC 11395 / H) TaxID=869212 RepID=I4B688_TURPD|nr:DASS family sodium-coupled anion symporter [Turneriella parva]AFM12795.1 anion transporter [Turneriella parva DSM 21527]
MAEQHVYTTDEKFDVIRSRVGLILGPAVAVLVYFLPLAGLSQAAHVLAAVLSLVIIWWISECIPIPATSLLGLALCSVMGVETPRKVFAAFADPVIFLFIGSFILAQAMSRHGLDSRLAYSILSVRAVSARPFTIVLAFGLLSAVLSMWISNTATVAMLIPISVGVMQTISRASEKAIDLKNSRLASALVLAAAFGASIGGIATPVGSPPNLIGLGLINEVLGVRVSFFQWMQFALPMTLVMLVVLFIILALFSPSEVKSTKAVAGYLAENRKSLPKFSRAEFNVLLAFAFTVALWVLPGVLSAIFSKDHALVAWLEHHIPESVAALLGASLLFILPVNFREREFTTDWVQASQIDWGTIMLFGSGLAFGALMFQTGLAESVGKSLLYAAGAQSSWSITLLAIALAVTITSFASNTASANMVIPVVISLAKAANIDPVPPAMGACLGASFGFLLPVSTPPNALAYASGLVPITRLIKLGLLLSIAGIFVLFVGMYLLPLKH